jgi:uncharacterized membrane protein
MVIMAWLHIFTALGWTGAVMIFVMVVGPTMAKLSPPARGELAVKLIPRFVRYMASFGILTLAFGVGLAFLRVGDFSAFSPSTVWGLRITTGASLALLALITGLTVTLPTGLKMVRLITSFQKSPEGQPPAELPRLQKRMARSGFAVMTLLILALIFMVAAARL